MMSSTAMHSTCGSSYGYKKLPFDNLKFLILHGHPTMRWLLLSFIPGICLIARPVLTTSTFYTHETRSFVMGPSSSQNLHKDSVVPLRIALKQRGLEDLPLHLLAVSDPSSPNYGQHWTAQRVVDAFSPSQESIDVVKKWLVDSGFDPRRIGLRVNRGWVDVADATVHEVENLLRTEYKIFKRHDGEETVGCHSYQLPNHLAAHVDFVLPTVQSNIRFEPLGEVQGRAVVPHWDDQLFRRQTEDDGELDLSRCSIAMAPPCLRALYNITYRPKTPAPNNSFAVVNFHPNTYLQSDLDMFFKKISPSLIGQSPDFVSVDGGSLNGTSFGELGWILQYAMSLSAPQEVTLLKVGDQTVSGPFGGVSFNEWLDAVDGSYCTSDGGDDLNFDPQFPNPFPDPGAFNDHSCGIVRPPNVISVSRGDEEGRLRRVAPNATLFNPAWPGSCPWITSVGGTQLRANASITDPDPEEVASRDLTMGFFTSGGGGFSRRFSTPSYQAAVVDKYLDGLRRKEPSKLTAFNARGRGYPDLSVISNRYVSVEDGSFVLSSGVSGSSPVVGAMISLINDARLARGKRPVGFINPAIYSTGFSTAFRDVIYGTNTGCKGLQGVRNGGFSAVPGWDPASGGLDASSLIPPYTF
ncbi:hypothetical protein ONZ45_g11978 [Pleurotus djamor]|nr:hypothetical protein ONZ45_g11978 [Pleurotus djamor]